MTSTNPFHAITEKAIRDGFEQMDRTMLTPWVFLNAGNRIEITNCRGRTIQYEGAGFEGSPRDVFWGGFFTPCIEDQITERLLDALKLCRETQWYEPSTLNDAAELLRVQVAAFYHRMSDIDRRLRGRGRPQEVPLRDVAADIARMNELIDAHLEGLQRILAHERPSWVRQNFWWLGPLAAAVVGSIPGFLALLKYGAA